MRVVSHRLVHEDGNPVRFERTPNQSGLITPRFLVIHYTAGRSLEGAVAWLADKQSKASAHLVIGRDGEIVQMVRFDRKAWHAGRSGWDGLDGLNAWSIGIELDNAGELSRTEGGAWRAWFGETYKSEEVLQARHRHDPSDASASGWHVFTAEQLDTLTKAAFALHARYGFEAVLGHDDIAPGRKRDPGPAFPMDALRARLFGRADEKAAPVGAKYVCSGRRVSKRRTHAEESS